MTADSNLQVGQDSLGFRDHWKTDIQQFAINRVWLSLTLIDQENQLDQAFHWDPIMQTFVQKLDARVQ